MVMATNLQHYRKSAFPPILSTYLPLRCRNQNNHKRRKTVKDDKGKKRNNNSAFSEEGKEGMMKQALLDQYHLEMCKDLYRQRNATYVHYRDLLNKKVQKQRIQIQMSDCRLKQNLEQQRRRKCIPGHQVPYCKLSHDAKYLESIPQSCNYLIVGLQNELIKCGVLKNQQDCEDFWTLIPQSCHSSQLKGKLEDIKSKMIASKSLPSRVPVRTSTAQPTDVFLSQRYGKLKESSANVSESMCCQPLPHHPSKHMKSQKETEQIFPKLQFSRLSELQKRPEELLQTQEEYRISKRSKKYFEHKKRLFYLHHIYHLAFLNMASSKRRLEQNNQFADVENECSVHDLMIYLFPSEHKSPCATKRETEGNVFPGLAGRKQQEQHCKRSSKARTLFKEMRNEDNGAIEIPEDWKSSVSDLALHEMTTVPLTLEDVALKHPVLEAKSVITYWTNYADEEEEIP
ncbi:uncharacterized protein [Struthio camelus]|uniref:uncharacterized protein isoform X2 n=1 Tax=Struthio camelus TaxID=8801 RepID=UPI0036042135